jgi:hypothetical protein
MYERETRIVTAPNKSRLKSRKWIWVVQRRDGGVRIPRMFGDTAPDVSWGIWYEVARGYARHQPAAEQAARLWLDEEALKIRTAQAKVEAQAERARKQAELTTIINVEEN